jgi:hypothetical protein
MPATAYSPSSNAQGNLPQSVVKFYDKKFRENLKSQTPFVACAVRLDLPKNSGNNYNIFQYSPFAANTSQANEGEVDAGIQASVIDTNFTIGEYADYANFSSLALATAIDPVVENVSREMAYRLGLSLSALVQAEADGAHSIDGSVQVQLASGTKLSRNDIVSAVQSMAGRAIRPPEGESMFVGVIHPFAVGDVSIDTSNNSPIDIWKHTPAGLMKMEDLPGVALDEMIVLPGSGVKFHQTNKVLQTSNYKGVTGATALRTYIFGRDGVFAVKLGANGDTGIGDGRWQNLSLFTEQNAPRSVADPSGLIPGFCSYKVHFTSGLGPDSTQRLRTIDAVSAVS